MPKARRALVFTPSARPVGFPQEVTGRRQPSLPASGRKQIVRELFSPEWLFGFGTIGGGNALDVP
jgi:hypothetical protein